MFRLHRSERSDALVDALVAILADPLDPFVAEIVAVPTRGVERWLTHRIAGSVGAAPGRSDGVCANVDFPFPGRLVGDVLARATGVEPALDPWRPERLVWAVLAEIDAGLDEAVFASLARHVGGAGADGDELRRARRFTTARRVAGLFDRYGTFRPDLITTWAGGEADVDALTPRLDPNDDWQRELWQRVRSRLGVDSPAERLGPACEAIAADEVPLELPERISLFGLTRLPATYLHVLRAIARHRDVHLFALHPSLVLWDRMAEQPVSLPRRRTDDPTRTVPANPLLRTWGADTREMQLVLASATDVQDAHHPVAVPDVGTTLLARIQDDIRHDRVPVGAPSRRADERLVLAPDDRSIQVLRTHGQARQVEVIRDAICHALADDPTLEPREIIVLCPDIDAFAPLLHAAFGAVNVGDADRGIPDLPYRLADRSLRQTNPLLGALDALLGLVESRHSAPDLVTFFGRDPVRRRFGFDDDDLDRMHGWMKEANVRWGLDAADRERFALGTVDANTWRAGIDRLLLGIAMDGDGARMVDGRLPLDDVGSGDIDLAGRLAEAIDRFATVVEHAVDEHPIAVWADILSEATDLLFAVDRDEGWMRVQVDDLLRDVLADAGFAAGTSAPTVPLCLAEVRALLADRLRGVPTRADFRTGAVTMCTLVPMRAVPHRVVCLLGLDDDSFPRPATIDGDDLLRRDPLIGDPDQRTEDRQLLLDAVLSATDRLIIATTGHDVRTNEARPPAVPLAELLGAIDATAVGADHAPATAQVIVDHALQPFDARPHLAGPLGHPWAFDRVQLAGALAAQGERARPAPFLASPLGAPDPAPTEVDLDTLIRFFAHPAREFLRQRLSVNTWDDDDRLADAIPVALDGLASWGVGSRLLDHRIAGRSADAAEAIELANGAVPPGLMGARTLHTIGANASVIFDLAERRSILPGIGDAPSASTHEIDLVLPSGTIVTGIVGGVVGTTIGTVTYSSLKAKAKLDHWVRQLALTAAEPDVAWTGCIVARNKSSAQAWSLRPVAGPDDGAEVARDWALGFLDLLVDLWRTGMCEPLPLPAQSAAAWSIGGTRGAADAEREWTTSWDFPNDDQDASWVRVLGGVLRFDQLLALPPTDAEVGPGWDRDDPSRFSRLAHRVWDPIHARSGR